MDLKESERNIHHRLGRATQMQRAPCLLRAEKMRKLPTAACHGKIRKVVLNFLNSFSYKTLKDLTVKETLKDLTVKEKKHNIFQQLK